jgi:hypothetical protein
MKKSKIYISGKITGLDLQEAENLFNEAETMLLKREYCEVVNPMKLDHSKHDQTWESFMMVDLKALIDCDGIYMLENWESSKGARIEHQLAEQLGLKFYI